MAIVISPAAEVTILNVGWPVYEAFVQEAGDHGHSRMAYNGELLEIMSPSRKHEIYARLLDILIFEVGRAWSIKILATGSVTLKAKPHGAEADSSFYVGDHAASMRSDDELDLSRDPAPDIVVEVDISRERIDKTALYSALGVSELWRYDGRRLRAYDLRTATSPEVHFSSMLAGLPLAELDRFLELRRDHDGAALAKMWHDWLCDNRPA
jgi:Uma2 family endonuclease